MKVLFLYTELTPSVISVIRVLSELYEAEVHVLYWETGGNTPYIPPEISNVSWSASKGMSSGCIARLSTSLNPDVVYVTAWQDKRYLLAAHRLRLQRIPVVAGFDDVWDGAVRQWFGALLVRIIGGFFFSHAMVSGPRQYEYARRFGFSHLKILYYLFSADAKFFSSLAQARKEFEGISENRRKKFVFVGQYIHRKGIDVLVSAFKRYQKLGGSWELVCIGSGDVEYLLKETPGVVVHSYLSHPEMHKVLLECDVFVLPSRRDVSPLVVHEFATAGFPLILSDAVGNRHMFLISGFNGITFKNGDSGSLSDAMLFISKKTDVELEEMGNGSFALARQHQSEYVAASLLSVVQR